MAHVGGAGLPRRSQAPGVHRLETGWAMMVTSQVVTVVLAVAAFRWAIPMASESIGKRLPVAADARVGQGVLSVLTLIVFLFLRGEIWPPARSEASACEPGDIIGRLQRSANDESRDARTLILARSSGTRRRARPDERDTDVHALGGR